MVYYAVVFVSIRHDSRDNGYSEQADEMVRLASVQPGFLKVESFNNTELGKNITISYWKTLDDVKRWKADMAHQQAQEDGKAKWYKWYSVKVCRVEREYEFTAKL